MQETAWPTRPVFCGNVDNMFRRLASPTEAWYEGKWLPGEFELVN